jgi:hypothetical protein
VGQPVAGVADFLETGQGAGHIGDERSVIWLEVNAVEHLAEGWQHGLDQGRVRGMLNAQQAYADPGRL